MYKYKSFRYLQSSLIESVITPCMDFIKGTHHYLFSISFNFELTCNQLLILIAIHIIVHVIVFQKLINLW